MKKLFCFMLALFLVLCIGCKTIDNASSLIEQLNNSSVEETSSDDTATQSTDAQVSEPAPSTPSTQQTPSTPSSSQVEIITETVKESDIATVKPEPVVIKGETPMSYSYITDEQKRIYEILKVAIRDMEDKLIDLQIEYDKSNEEKVVNDINIAFRSVSVDNPELFWIPSGYGVKIDQKKYFVAFKGTDEDGKQYDFPISKSKRDTMKKELDEEVSKLANTVKNKNMDAFEAERYIHDYLCEKITYTKTNDPMVYTTYGALVNGKAVCEGYSRAMQLLCDKVGIPCGLIYGSSRGEGHMWNIISLDDDWYHLDVTWDDDETNGVISHRYFNITTADISSDHIIADAYKKSGTYKDVDVYNFLGTSCDAKKLNYFERLGLVVKQNIAEAGTLAKQFVNNGKTYFEIKNNASISNSDIIHHIVTELGRAVRYYETNNVITIIL